MVAPEDKGWIPVKPRGKKAVDVYRGEENALRGTLKVATLETGGFGRLGRVDRDVFKDVAESSATLTESSSRTSRSASPSIATAHGDSDQIFPAKAKRKRHKKRKPKTAPGQIPISLDALNAAITGATSNYADNQSTQLGTVTDFFINHYQSSELPFRKFLQEQPLHKAAEVPLAAVPTEVVQRALAFYRGYDMPSLSAHARSLVDTVFIDIPRSAEEVPPKAKVGHLVSLALVLRAVPVVAVMLSEGLLQGHAHYSSPQRLPFLLWTLAQAAIGDVSVGVAVWVRVLLPQVLGSHLAVSKEAPPPRLGEESAAAALGFMDLCLAAVRPPGEPVQLNRSGYPKWNAGTVALGPEDNALVHGARKGVRWSPRKGKRVMEPVVPPTALDALVRLSFGSKPVLRAKDNAHLHRHYERLQELAVEGIAHGGVAVSELVRLSLEAAAEAAQGTAASEPVIVEEAARTLLMCLTSASSSATAVAWQNMHRKQLLGSAAVLQNLASSCPPHLHKTLSDLELQRRHSSILASGKGAQLAAAQSAEAACEALKTRLNGRIGSGIPVMAALALVGGSALAAVAISQTKPFQDFASQSDTGFVRAALSTLTSVVEQLPPAVLNVAHEAAGLAESANEKAQPLLHHLRDALGGLYEIVAAYSVQGLRAASMAQQAISARINGLIAS